MQLTLDQVLQRLHQVHNQLAESQRMLAQSRDAEVAATEAYRMAKARAYLDDECPRPKRGENGVTVADRDAWVDRRVEAERQDARAAEATRQAAEDHMRVTRDQASTVQSMSALLRAEMSLAGSPGSA